uniref:Transport and Golgi organization protein 6 homolog n=1 Tax=Malurus cyaneus samueli TaxID=2593467 RepID=A0A8C5TRV3_9PASS
MPDAQQSSTWAALWLLPILELLHIQDKAAARQFQRVATTTLLTMAQEQPQLAQRHLLQPLLAPLHRCSQAAAPLCPIQVFDSPPVPFSPLLLGSLQSVLGVVFCLYSFAKQNVSYLRSPCQEILLWFLEKAERERSLTVLEGLAGLSSHVPTLHPQCQLRVGSEGGAAVVVEETISDEDEALYQKISSEQCRVESLVELLSHCQKSGLAGDFFIHCLKELTQVAAEDEVAPNPAVEPGESLLELEQHQARQGRKLLVLQLMAALCEGVSDTVFTDIVQVQEFVGAVLHRACAHPAQGPGAATEAQTLAMAMGLVATVLGGSTNHEPSASSASPAPCADSLAPAGLQELLLSAYDPQPPCRAAALRHLASLVTQRAPEALELQEKLLQVFLENMQHEDAFVYLSAIQGDWGRSSCCASHCLYGLERDGSVLAPRLKQRL